MNDERIKNYRSTLDLANELVEKQQRRIAELEAVIAKHDLCHDLHGKVGRAEFEEGCRRETVKEFGSCGWAERIAELEAERNAAVKALNDAGALTHHFKTGCEFGLAERIEWAIDLGPLGKAEDKQQKKLQEALNRITELDAENTRLYGKVDGLESTLEDEEFAHQETLRMLKKVQAELATLQASRRAGWEAAYRDGWLVARDKAISLGLFSMRLVPVADLPANWTPPEGAK